MAGPYLGNSTHLFADFCCEKHLELCLHSCIQGAHACLWLLLKYSKMGILVLGGQILMQNLGAFLESLLVALVAAVARNAF